MKTHIPFFLVLLGLAFAAIPSAHAQEREMKAGIHTTRLYNKPLIKREQETHTESAPQDPPSDTAEDQAEERVWQRYKAMAGGQSQENPETKAPMKTLDLAQPEEPEKTQSSGLGAGIPGLLKQWQDRKNGQKDMHSKSFAVPEHLKLKTTNEKHLP